MDVWKAVAGRGAVLLGALLVGCGVASAPGAAPPASPSPSPSQSPRGEVVAVLPLAASGAVCKDGRAVPGRVVVGRPEAGPVDGCPEPVVFRAFLAFSWSAVPRGAAVVAAELVALRRQTGIPYAVRGQRLLAEAVQWASTRGGLDPEDFDEPALPGPGPVVLAEGDGERLQVDVLALVRAFVERELGTVSFRLRFSLEPAPPGTLANSDELLAPVVLRVTYSP
jgi:hypothetical protein